MPTPPNHDWYPNSLPEAALLAVFVASFVLQPIAFAIWLIWSAIA